MTDRMSFSRSADKARRGRPFSKKRPSVDSMAYLAEPEEPPWCGRIDWKGAQRGRRDAHASGIAL
ncbi:MAG: hypothetical protein AAFO67_08475, partial [Planctomycetota bacterium]